MHHEGPILILAGAGSGKTRVLTKRIVHLIKRHNVDPQSILAVTFTNKATREMEQRLESELGGDARKLWVATFHSAALRILRRHAKALSYTSDFVVYDAQDSKSLLKKIMKELKVDEGKFSTGTFQKAIERAKNNLRSPEELLKDAKFAREQTIAEVYDRYQRELRLANAMDFGDLLYNVVLLFKKERDILAHYQRWTKFLLIDEFQDTNLVQYLLIRMLAAPQNNLFVVGDDDQSIYAFRGATIENILNFERDFPETKVVKLEQNYRSTPHILEAANAVIAHNSDRKDKQLWTAEKSGEKIHSYVARNESDEARFISGEIGKLKRAGRSYKEMALFYRTNAQSRALEEALMNDGIPYRIYGGLKFYDRKEIKDILAYLKIISNDRDNQSFLRVVNNPPRGIGPKTVQQLVSEASAKEMALYPYLREHGSTHKGLSSFLDLMEEFISKSQKVPLYELVTELLEKSGYLKRMEEQKAKDISVQSQIENLGELRNIAAAVSYELDNRADELRAFLDRVSLTSSQELPVQESADEEKQEEPEVVSLMTLHLAKGLEYPVVFFSGLEEGILPHYHSKDDPTQCAEERRLCYVGMTRAMEILYMTRADSRGMFSAAGSFGLGSGGLREPSRFLYDVPSSCFKDGMGPIASAPSPLSEEDEELFSSHLFSRKGPQPSAGYKTAGKSGASPRRRGAPVSLVQSADALASTPEYEEYTTAPKAELDTLQPGVRVIHKTFGPGKIESISLAATGDKNRSKVLIQFDNFDSPKKLVFKQARLALELT